MSVQLINRDVTSACERLLKIDDNEHNCSGFVRAVADDLMIFLPGASGNANGQVDFMDLIGNIPRLFYHLGTGRSAEQDAVDYARKGNFVVCGMTSAELQKNREKKVSNGHVAIVGKGWSKTGWPIAWWGQLGGTPGYGESLSRCFRAADREQIKYFSYLI